MPCANELQRARTSRRIRACRSDASTRSSRPATQCARAARARRPTQRIDICAKPATFVEHHSIGRNMRRRGTDRLSRKTTPAAETVVDLALRLLEHLATAPGPLGISELTRVLS